MTSEAEPNSQLVHARVPNAVAKALKDDAAELQMKPGTLVRRMLEKRYSSALSGAGESIISNGKHVTTSPAAEATEEPDWESSPLPKD